jgi:cytochrome P450
LLERFTAFELTVPPEELRWKSSLFVRGPLSLPMRYRPAAPTEI